MGMQPTVKELEVRKAIKETMEDLSPDARARVLQKVSDQFDTRQWANAMLPEVKAELKVKEGAMAASREQLAALNILIPWFEAAPFKLERNDCSRIHKLAEAFKEHRVLNVEASTVMLPGDGNNKLLMAHPFVVEHDWARAFENATDYTDGEFNLPFEHCAFEFRVSGRTVIVIAMQPTEETLTHVTNRPDSRHVALPFIECGGYWFCRGKLGRDDPSLQFVWTEIRAVCIALDAEVAQRDVVRASVSLNEKRERSGKVPLRDYHVVRLRGRMTRQQMPGQNGTHRSPRLHFRRGHWRHFETHKTWIRWMLVGNPELGFIDKSYRL